MEGVTMFVPRSVLSQMPVCADSTSQRYALGGVHLEREGELARAVTTDGTRLLLAEWDDGELRRNVPEVAGVLTAVDEAFATEGTLICSSECNRLAKMAKPSASASGRLPHTNSVVLQEAGANGTLKAAATDGSTSSTAEVATVEGRFPKWRDVVPDYSGKRVSHFTFQTPEESDEQTTGIWRKDELALRTETETAQCRPKDAVLWVRVNAKFLAECALAISKMSCSAENAGVDLLVPLDPFRPIILSKQDADVKCKAVIMPIRD